MENSNAKDFDLGSILTVTTGVILAESEEVYDILSFLSGIYAELDAGGNVKVLPAPQMIRTYILSIYPQLENVTLPKDKIKGKADAIDWVNSQKLVYGNSLSLAPMPLNNKLEEAIPSGNLNPLYNKPRIVK